MKLLDFAIIYNTTGVAAILLLSLLILRKYPSLFFKRWTMAYLGGLLLLILENGAARFGRPAWLVLPEIALVTTIIWVFVLTGKLIQGNSSSLKGYWAVLVGAMALGSLLMAAGLPFPLIFGPFVVIYSGAHIWLGWTLLKASHAAGLAGGRWLGLPLICSGLWFFTYPVLEQTSYGWAGYFISCLFNVFVGIGMIVFLVEDTSRRLETKNEELDRLNSIKSAFLQTMSHEFKTPLTSIKTASWLMAQRSNQLLDERQTELMGMIQEQTDHLDYLVQSILDFACMESGTLTYSKSTVNLSELASSVVQAMEPAYLKKGVALEYQPAATEVLFLGDPNRIKQVLMNLLDNALKFTPSGGRVRVCTRLNGDFCIAEVSDTGIGIPEELHETVFERFYQVDDSTTRKAGGMGLGLALCMAIVKEGHGGRITLSSQPGNGSQFSVWLPSRSAPGNPLQLFATGSET